MAQGHATGDSSTSGGRVSVLLPLPLSGAYDYRVPENLHVKTGDIVTVPLGNRQVRGVVWGAGSEEVADEKLKEIIELSHLPRLADPLRRLIDWVAAYTLSPPGAVLRMTLNVPSALDPPKASTAYLPALDPARLMEGDSRIRMTESRRKVLASLADGPPRSAAEIGRAAGVSASVVRGMADIGLLKPVSVTPSIDLPVPDWQRRGPVLSDAQAKAATSLVCDVERSGGEDGFSVTLLDGVTGSGKTEVYFEAIAAALAKDEQVMVLLPEIALTAQWLERFNRRFGASPLEWHSDLTGAERRLGWQAVIAGEAKVVVGARSGLFLPFPELGLIVIDEEHDPSFKQEDGVIYNARDMAVVRAQLGRIPIVLASATPSLETSVNADSGRYRRVRLPERHGGASLPDIVPVDMREEEMDRQSWLSPTLQGAIAQTLAAGEQTMLFLNRRGYAPLTLCRQCGHRLECPNCTAWLVEHRLEGRLECHHCGLSVRPPETCPKCDAADTLAACGPGVERLAEEVAERFPQSRFAVMASDTLQGPAAAARLVQRMQARDIDILIGTQVMAKGHHFPFLTLVGVIDADLGLAGGDLRASERTFQLLHQVSGRAGREDRPGTVLLQTFQPDHAVMQALASGDRDRFLESERRERERHTMPPYGRLAALIVSGPDGRRVEDTARALARSRPADSRVQVLGPAPAPMSILRGRHRMRLLAKAPRDVNMQAFLRSWLQQMRPSGGVRIQVDVDPYSFM